MGKGRHICLKVASLLKVMYDRKSVG